MNLVLSPGLLQTFDRLRQATEKICEPLEVEDFVVQPSSEVSPPKWHLAHTSWFFDKFLVRSFSERSPFHPDFDLLFNSYYKSVGPHWSQASRGTLSRPLVKDIYAYRAWVNQGVQELVHEIDTLDGSKRMEFERVLELGIHHEQQHQELLLMDILAIFATNKAVYRKRSRPSSVLVPPDKEFVEYKGGIVHIGASSDSGFCFDNEKAQHEVSLRPFSLRRSLVSNQEYLEFIQDGGYRRPEYWHSDGWNWVETNRIELPCYWKREGQEFWTYSLHGLEALEPDRPVSHLNFYEASAFANWAQMRLPTEFEWEAASHASSHTRLLDYETFTEGALEANYESDGSSSFHGGLWEWTSSAYLPYPGYRPFTGAFGEYNGKFMCNQMVLRGGSWATPRSHYRRTYRNFFYPNQSWAFTGLRLAK